MKRKWIVWLLTLAMLVALLPQTVLPASAAENVKVITVGVHESLIASLGETGWAVYYEDNAGNGVYADCTSGDASLQKNVGSNNWGGAAQTFHMFSAYIPKNASFFQVSHTPSNRWFGEDCDVAAQEVVWVYNNRGDKARYEYKVLTTEGLTGGKVTVDKRSAGQGETVTVTAVPDSDYQLDTITVNGTAISGNTFQMPSGPAEVGASFIPGFSIFTLIGATASTNSNEGPAQLLDNDMWTKWTVSDITRGTAYIEFSSPCAILPQAYILTTAEDAGLNPNTNPTHWTLKGKLKKSDDWTVLASVSGDTTIPQSSFTKTQFGVENPIFSRYFRWEITAVRGGSCFQMADIKLVGSSICQLAAHPASCTDIGCSVDCFYYNGQYYQDEECSIPLPAAGVELPMTPHQPIYYPALAPVGVGNGFTEHWVCAACGRYFSDAACTNEIAQDDAISYISCSYLDENGMAQQIPTYLCGAVTETGTAWNEADYAWYVVEGNVEIHSRIEVTGHVNLLLTDGATLTAHEGIKVGSQESLTIYAQSADAATMGVLLANGVSSDCAGIGSGENDYTGNITINGGKVTATGGSGGAGIGGGYYSDIGFITVNGGIVTAAGGSKAPGIGGSETSGGGGITINGGTVTATGGDGGAGIGSCRDGHDGSITINGGTVTATGGDGGAGIGGGRSCRASSYYDITINGGTVSATGGSGGAGIGGGDYALNGDVVISGGDVTAVGGQYGAGIGSGERGVAHDDSYYIGNITVHGGTVNANNGYAAAGIGGGYMGTEGTITIDGGTVTAVSGSFGVGIGCGNHGSYEAIIINGGNVTATASPDRGSGIGIVREGTGGPIELSWTNADDSITSFSYNGTVTLQKDFSSMEGDFFAKGEVTDNSVLAGKTLVPLTVSYLDAAGVLQEKPDERTTGVTSETTTFSAGWYVVMNDVTVDSRITCSGDVHLILCDNATLTAPKGITVSGGNSLTVYAQSTDESTMGALCITEPDNSNAGIGGSEYSSAGAITINGGNVAVVGGKDGAGIGGSFNRAGGTTTVNGGKVNASGGENGAGIGGGYYGAGGEVTIHGGAVTATGGFGGAGIGGGFDGDGGQITVRGGTVIAAGGQLGASVGAGIGGDGGTVSLLGGTVNATGGIGTSGITGADGTISLNWTEPTDSITASSYHGTVTLEKTFTDGTDVFSGSVSDNSALSEKTLIPYYFTILWKDDDGTVLETDYDMPGILPTYDGATPTKAEPLYDNVFTGWDREIVPVTEDATYTATYTATRLPYGFTAHSLTLEGDIGINYFVPLTEAEIAGGAEVRFSWTVGGVEKTDAVTLTAVDRTEIGYKASVPLPVAEMTYAVTAALAVGGVECATDTYSVKEYADTILSDDYKIAYFAQNHTVQDYARLENLIETMLIYGAKAQINFDRNTANLADRGLLYTMLDVTVDMIPSTASDMTEGLDEYGLQYAGTTLVYLAKTSMRHYYTVVDWDKFNAVKDSITFNGEKASYQMKDGKIYFELKNIAAADLDTVYTLRIGTNEYQSAALDYVRNCLSASNAPYTTKQLVMATYWYNQAANAYFGR